MKELQMQTIQKPPSRYNRSESGILNTIPTGSISSEEAKKMKIREFISWSVCLAIVTSLTGLLLFLKVGITMESITIPLFWLSLGGMLYCISRIILISRRPLHFKASPVHELN
jgi:hypothetical protein